jgi:hypothetical protein
VKGKRKPPTPKDEPTPFDRFVRKIAAVPKAVVDARAAAEKAKRT